MRRQAFCLQRSHVCPLTNNCYLVYARPTFMVQHKIYTCFPLALCRSVGLHGPQHLGLLIWSIYGPIYFPYTIYPWPSLVSSPGRLLLHQLTQFHSLSSVTLSAYLFSTDLISSYYLQRWTSSALST